MPDYVANGRPYICWAHILGRCTYGECQYKRGHVPRSAITDSFTDDVVAMLMPGVQACVNGGRSDGSPGKRQRMDGQHSNSQNVSSGNRD
jgi:hypothetical protein